VNNQSLRNNPDHTGRQNVVNIGIAFRNLALIEVVGKNLPEINGVGSTVVQGSGVGVKLIQDVVYTHESTSSLTPPIELSNK
jgi:hypothetical protein